MQVNNAGILGVEVDGDALVFEERFDADVALVYTGKVRRLQISYHKFSLTYYFIFFKFQLF